MGVVERVGPVAVGRDHQRPKVGCSALPAIASTGAGRPIPHNRREDLLTEVGIAESKPTCEGEGAGGWIEQGQGRKLRRRLCDGDAAVVLLRGGRSKQSLCLATGDLSQPNCGAVEITAGLPTGVVVGIHHLDGDAASTACSWSRGLAPIHCVGDGSQHGLIVLRQSHATDRELCIGGAVCKR